uniref:Phostensin/Taperin PP1-binding domain-containing protein n=1 Tax=Oreochromis niloticus TaxID=8128 RepID=A0A669DSH0_ORENI
MSVSSLPEWKQLLLEKKRREEEERERREKEEEEKFASMPAWKRGIIQRRKAKQDFITVNLGNPKPVSQVSVETIVPVHENPFILTQSAWRKSRDGETGNEPEVKERDKLSPRSQDGELGRGRDIELKKERFRDLSEGREKDRSRDRSQGRERENSREGCEKEKSQVLKQQRKDDFRKQQIKDDLKAHQIKDDVKTQEKDQETPDLNPKVSPHHVCSPTPQAKQTITITPSYLRTQSPDNSLKATDCAPTPASSPSSPSPAQSPSVSPSPTSTPVLFSIRSQQTQTVSTSAKIPPQQQTQTAPAVTEPGKKKYPTVEEIEVIGGYQNLEKSCLVKNRGTPKKVRQEKIFFSQSCNDKSVFCFLVPLYQFSCFC